MYERFYRLRERPFALTPDPDYLYPSRVHREAMNYLRYGIETQAGFVVITGAIGSGKTTLLQTLLRGLDSHTTVARVMNTLLDPRELIEAAMIDLGLDPAGKSKPAMLKDFGEFLVAERAAGRLVLLVIDEAQNLTLPALEEIRMLSNLETGKSKLVQIILVGQPDLRDKLDRPELEQLRQRITVSYHLEPLDSEETARYVNHRLARASVGAPLEFQRPVTDRIHVRSAGVPRLINVIADATLVFGYGEERPEIDDALVQEVIADLDATGVLGPAPNPERHASVVPPDAAAESGFRRIDGDLQSGREGIRLNPDPTVVTETGPDPAVIAALEAERQRLEALAADGTRRADELAVRERHLVEREQDVELRERELVEQRRVLVDQYRILKSTTAAATPPPATPVAAVSVPAAAPPAQPWSTRPAAPSAAGAAVPAGAANASTRLVTPQVSPARQGWPSARVAPTAAEAQQAQAQTSSARWQPPHVYHPKRPSLWRRVKHTLLGSPEPVLEDSL
jgi:putative secretion ATPase (PEP-CTERM system associated)